MDASAGTLSDGGRVGMARECDDVGGEARGDRPAEELPPSSSAAVADTLDCVPVGIDRDWVSWVEVLLGAEVVAVVEVDSSRAGAAYVSLRTQVSGC